MTLLWILMCLGIVSVLLYLKSRTFKFFVRVMIFPLIAVTSSTIFLPLAILFPDPKHLMNMAAPVRWARPLIGVDFELEGCENIQNKPHVIVLDHRSHLDILGIFNKYHWFHPCVPVIKHEAKYLSLSFGWLLSVCGALFINRRSSEDAKRHVNERLEHLKATSTSIIMFPEGTRNRTKETFLPFKKGAFHMAIAVKMPILPIVFSDYSSFYSKKEKRFDRGRVIMKVLPEIPTEHLTEKDVDELCKKTFELMKKAKEEFRPVLVS